MVSAKCCLPSQQFFDQRVGVLQIEIATIVESYFAVDWRVGVIGVGFLLLMVGLDLEGDS